VATVRVILTVAFSPVRFASGAGKHDLGDKAVDSGEKCGLTVGCDPEGWGG
jgi:hypothetical protein